MKQSELFFSAAEELVRRWSNNQPISRKQRKNGQGCRPPEWHITDPIKLMPSTTASTIWSKTNSFKYPHSRGIRKTRLGFDVDLPFDIDEPRVFLQEPTLGEEAWMEEKDRVLQTATEILRQIYTPTLREQLEDAVKFQQFVTPRSPQPWYKKLVHRVKIHMHYYCEALADKQVPYSHYEDY
jgi:hypothetical protein